MSRNFGETIAGNGNCPNHFKSIKAMKSDYDYCIEQQAGIYTAIIIEDLNRGGMSVTNNIDHIVEEICTKEKLDATKCIIVYKDSIGNWDGWNASTHRFYHTGGNNGSEAVTIAFNQQQIINALDINTWEEM